MRRFVHRRGEEDRQIKERRAFIERDPTAGAYDLLVLDSLSKLPLLHDDAPRIGSIRTKCAVASGLTTDDWPICARRAWSSSHGAAKPPEKSTAEKAKGE